ncbi:D-amino-acid oxidase [Xylariaceae sp. FL0804]|nr:D-amino-acid oxidase [Xylariaceae sp. FL0804]
MMNNIVVLGAGVSGLTSALLLARTGRYNITIAAKHMPGDYDIEYASPWAGADYSPNLAMKHDVQMAEKRGGDSSEVPSSQSAQFERATWGHLAELARDVPEAGIHFQTMVSYRRAKDTESAIVQRFARLMEEDPWFGNNLPDFRLLSDSDTPPDICGGYSFTSVCINTSLYLPWLASQCLRLGVHIRRGIATHITDAAAMHHSGKLAAIVVNCTGLSSLFLGGVQDQTLYPARGQVAVVRNDPGRILSISGTDDAADESCYMMHRAAGGGCILGGCFQEHKWDSQPDINLATRIMKRCLDLCPELVPPSKGIEALSVVRHGVGLRPMRERGIRCERDIVNGVLLVHNYGHGGYGYQTSYGAAQKVEELVRETLDENGL